LKWDGGEVRHLSEPVELGEVEVGAERGIEDPGDAEAARHRVERRVKQEELRTTTAAVACVQQRLSLPPAVDTKEPDGVERACIRHDDVRPSAGAHGQGEARR
jgi:hypothetical protein